MHELYAALVGNKCRNDFIFEDLLTCIKAGRSPILLTERTSQVDEFASRIVALLIGLCFRRPSGIGLGDG